MHRPADGLSLHLLAQADTTAPFFDFHFGQTGRFENPDQFLQFA
jgi:hypothetical protein